MGASADQITRPDRPINPKAQRCKMRDRVFDVSDPPVSVRIVAATGRRGTTYGLDPVDPSTAVQRPDNTAALEAMLESLGEP